MSSCQSLLIRSFVDVDSKERTKRIIKYAVSALLTAALSLFWNRTVDEEGYENLSSYKKNNFYNFAIGNGKFISIPKHREGSLLESFMERSVDSLFEGNDAFYEFGGYVWQQFVPPMIPDVHTLDTEEAAHSWLGGTVLGPIIDVGFNEDFKGSPIETDYDKSLPSFERYSENTSELARVLGQSHWARKREVSPKQIDHVISGTTGIVGTINKALFPTNPERRDLAFGLKNKFVSDSAYSTDVLNKISDEANRNEMEFRFKGSAENAVKYEKSAVLKSFVSGMNQAIRNLPDDEQRNGRMYLLDSLSNWNDVLGSSQKAFEKVMGGSTVDEKTILTSVPSPKIEWTKNKVKYEYVMTPQEYSEYISQYLKAVADSRAGIKASEPSEYQKKAQDKISSLTTNAKKKAKTQYGNKAKKLGGSN